MGEPDGPRGEDKRVRECTRERDQERACAPEQVLVNLGRDVGREVGATHPIVGWESEHRWPGHLVTWLPAMAEGLEPRMVSGA